MLSLLRSGAILLCLFEYTKASEHGASHALIAARELSGLAASSLTEDGEFENSAFWQRSESVLKDAWQAYEPRHPRLFRFDEEFENAYLEQNYLETVQKLKKSARSGENGEQEELILKELFQNVYPGVMRSSKIFTQAFVDELMGELDSIEATGIPLRRPNGMNRYGVIVENVPGGITSISPAIDAFIQNHLRPLAEALFPSSARREDTLDHFAFTVRYRKGEDVELKEHRDAAVLTLNLCLGERGFTGSELYFVDPERGDRHYLEHTPGAILIHRGGLRHSALPLKSGNRTNLIVWLFGRDGYVRDAEYDAAEHMCAKERWLPQHEHAEDKKEL